MPAIQQVYSIDVKNRYDLGYGDSDGETEGIEDLDPLDQLRKIEEQKQRERELKKQLKLKQQAYKKNQKRDVAPGKENRDLPPKRDDDAVEKNTSVKSDNISRRPVKGPSQGDRQYSNNEENRRPPRRRNDYRREPRGNFRGETGGEGDNFEDAPVLPGSKSNMEGEGINERPERYRGNRGGYRGSRGGYTGNFRNNGKREFDRRSGNIKSGVKSTDKRDGGGQRNWGTPGNEIEETNDDSLKIEPIGHWGDPVEPAVSFEDSKKETIEGEVEIPEEDKGIEDLPEPEPEETEMTLDEWKASQAITKKQEFNIRQPGEGEDNKKWGNLKLLKPSTASSKTLDSQSTSADNQRRQGKPAQIELDIRFPEQMKPTRGGRGRGQGRGRRGGSGRGGNFRLGGPRSNFTSYENRTWQIQPPDVLNEAEFPTLPAA